MYLVNKKSKIINIALIVSLAFACIFTGCSNLTDSAAYDGKIIVQGQLNFSNAVPSEVAEALNSSVFRSAIPDTYGWTFEVTASMAGKTDVTSKGTVTGSSFEIALSEGTWNITAVMKNNGDVVLSDTVTRTITSKNPTATLDFFLAPETSGKGSVSLELTTDSSLSISDVNYIICDATQSSAWPVGKDNRTISIANNSATFSVSNIPSGSYDITFNFYAGTNLKYSTTQTINILPNTTTNTWINGSNGLIASNAFNLTKSIADKFARTTFYVNNSTGSDTTGTGSGYEPYKTIAKAVEVANAVTVSGEKTIYVQASSTAEVLTKSLNLTNDMNIEVYQSIPGDKTGQYTITRENKAFTGNNQMVIVQQKTVTLTGLVIDGKGYSGAGSGMGIYNSGALTLNNCVITNNATSTDGAGIYNNVNGIININSTYISNNFTAFGNGGGIYNNKGTVNFNSGCIGKADASDYASTIESKRSNSAKNGGGVYVNGGTFNMKSTASIKYNHAENGAAVYASEGSGTVSGIVAYNYCSSTENTASAVVAYDSPLIIENAKFIKNKHSDSWNYGSAIFCTGGNANGITIKGTSYFDSEDIIGLDENENNCIKLVEDLNPQDENGQSKEFVASIYKKTGASGNKILSAETEALLLGNMDKFLVANDGGWEIIQSSSDTKNGVMSQVIYVAGAGASLSVKETKNGSKENPYTSLSAAISSVTQDNTCIFIDGDITCNSPINISEHSIIISKYKNATTSKLIYTGSNTFITTTKSISFNNIDITGSGGSNKRAIEASNSTTTITLLNTSISYFGEVDKGAGIWLKAGAGVELKGTSSITNCTASSNGGGIYMVTASCSVKLQDEVYLDEKSKIYIPSDGKITITGDLTQTTVASLKYASTPSDLTTKYQILAESTSGLIANYYTKFSTENGLEISNEGKLQKKQRTVSYNGNADAGFTVSNVQSAFTVAYNAQITLPQAPTATDNRQFKGWALSASGTTLYSPGSSYTVTQNVTFYAIWKTVVSETVNSAEDFLSIISNNSGADIRLSLGDSSLTINESDFITLNNTSLSITGGTINVGSISTKNCCLFTVKKGGILLLDGCTLNGVNGNGISAIYCEASTVTLQNSTVQGFISNGSGIISNYDGGVLNIVNSYIKNNQARYGAAISMSSTVNMISGGIIDNKGVNGAIISGSGNFNWKGGTISNNGNKGVFDSRITLNNTSGNSPS